MSGSDSMTKNARRMAFGTVMLLLSGLGMAVCLSAGAAGDGTPPPDTTPPAPVAGLVAADGKDGKVWIGWNASTDGDFAYYAIYSGTDFFLTVANRTAIVKLADNATTNFTAVGLTDGVQYFFAATAVDKSGNENRTVASVSATPTGSVVPDTTAPPAVTLIAAADARDGKVNLTWSPVNVPDFDHYSIYVSTQQNALVAGLSPALKLAEMSMGRMTLTGLNDSTTYYFAVTAVDRMGNEDRTVLASVQATPTAVPPTTIIVKEDDEGPEAANMAVYQVVIAILIVAVAALTTFKVLSAINRPPEQGMAQEGDGDAREDDGHEEEDDAYGNEEE